MKPSEKARETRARNREAQKRKEEERREARETMKRGLLDVLDSKEATPTEKLEASKMLQDILER